MGYALFWIEALAAGVLMAAAVTACAARSGRRWLQLAIPWTIVGIFLAGRLIVSIALGVLKYKTNMEPNWFFYSLSELLCLAVLATAVMVWGLRLRGAEPPPAAGWPRLKLLGAFAAALALQAITLWNMDSAARAAFDAAKTEAGALALSAAPARLPDSQNAALVYRRAFESYVMPAKLGKAIESKFDQSWGKYTEQPDMKDPDLAAFLEKNTAALRLLRRAATMPGCNFDRDYARPSLAIQLPEVSQMRFAARLLRLDALHQASRGNTRAAFEDLAALREVCRHQSDDALLIGFMVAAAIKQIEVRTSEDLLAASQPDAAAMALLPTDDPFTLMRSFERTLRMEEAFGLAAISSVSGSGLADSGITPDGPSLPATLPAPYRVFFLRQDMAYYRWLMGRAQRSAALPSWEMLGKLQEIEQDFSTHKYGILTSMLVPAMAKCAESACRTEAYWRLENVALAMSAYRVKNGRYPETLEALTPDFISVVPLDPFDGKPLRMTQADGGVVLYSIGPDGKDDVGREFNRDSKTGDLTFCLGEAYKARRVKAVVEAKQP